MEKDVPFYEKLNLLSPGQLIKLAKDIAEKDGGVAQLYAALAYIRKFDSPQLELQFLDVIHDAISGLNQIVENYALTESESYQDWLRNGGLG